MPRVDIVGAFAAGRDPVEVLDACDIPTLVRITEQLEHADGPTRTAAAALVGITCGRPFARANAAAGWLAAAHVLACSGLEVDLGPDEITSLVRRVRRGELDETGLAEELAAHLRPCTGRWRRAARAFARRLAAPVGPTAPVVRPCPTCARPIELSPIEHRSMNVGGSDAVRYELTARCWYVHRAHRRDGRPLARAGTGRDERSPQPVAVLSGRT